MPSALHLADMSCDVPGALTIPVVSDVLARWTTGGTLPSWTKGESVVAFVAFSTESSEETAARMPDMSRDNALGAIPLSVHVKVFDEAPAGDAAAGDADAGSGEDAIVMGESLATSGDGKHSTVC